MDAQPASSTCHGDHQPLAPAPGGMFSEPAGHADPNADANAQRDFHQLAYANKNPKTVIHTPAYPATYHHPFCHPSLRKTHPKANSHRYPTGNFQHDCRQCQTPPIISLVTPEPELIIRVGMSQASRNLRRSSTHGLRKRYQQALHTAATAVFRAAIFELQYHYPHGLPDPRLAFSIQGNPFTWSPDDYALFMPVFQAGIFDVLRTMELTDQFTTGHGEYGDPGFPGRIGRRSRR